MRSYDGVGNNVDDGRIQCSSEDRILFPTQSTTPNQAPIKSAHHPSSKILNQSIQLPLDNAKTHPVCDTQITASTSLKHPFNILFPQISAIFPNPNNE